LDASQLLDQLQATLLIPLRSVDGLIFVGPRETIDYLRTFITRSSGGSRHGYLYLSDDNRTWQQSVDGRPIVVASVVDEASTYADVVDRLAGIGASASVRRLFADILPNVISGVDLFHEVADLNGVPNVSYAIFGTPRSGSEFLCQILSSTGLAGFPREHLQIESQLLTQFCGFDCQRYLRVLMSRAVTANGVFGTKILSHFFMEHLRADPTLERFLSRFACIHIVRSDRIGQAISAMFAAKTNVWHIESDEEHSNYVDLLARLTITDDDVRRVGEIAIGLEDHERYLARFFARYGINSLTIRYEDVVEDPVAQLTTILSFLKIDVDGGVQSSPVLIRRTRSSLSEAVRERYFASGYDDVPPLHD
jgi:LPS sulfotransferase NodH